MVVRIGVAGLGAVAQSVHLPLIRRRWDLFELVAVADLSATTAAAVGEQFGVGSEHRYTDLVEMLEGEQLDGVLLLTSGSHGTPALEAITRGVAVFCEKPLAFSLAEIDLLERAEADAGRPMLLLAYMKEYDAATRVAQERLAELGALRFVDVEVLHPTGPSQLAFANLHPPARDVDRAVIDELIARDSAVIDSAIGASAAAEHGGLYANVVLGSLIHDISLLRHLVGEIERVDRVDLWGDPAEGDPGSIEISGSFASGARVHFGWHYLPDYPRYRETVRLHLERGSLELEFTVPYLLNAPTELSVTSSRGDAQSVELVRDVSEAFETELVQFASMVESGVRPPTGIEQGRSDVRTGQRIMAALVLGGGGAIGGEAAV